MSDLIIRFVKNWGINIVSDGDIDGVFATGLLLRGLKNSGVSIDNANVFFPRARERQNLEVMQSIMIELRPERGLIYKGQNILIDHHPDPPIIALYRDSELILIRKYNLDVSVAGLIHYIFEEVLDVPDELVDAVDAADYKSYEVPLARELTRAFLISRNLPEVNLQEVFPRAISLCSSSGKLYETLCGWIKNNSVYGYLVMAMILGLWNEILEWINLEARRYENTIRPVAKKLYNSAYGNKDVRWIIYSYGNKKERTAIDDVLYDLQKESKIVFVVGVTRNGFLVRITTKIEDIDLLSVCSKLAHLRIECGGRRDVVGMYFPRSRFTLDDVVSKVLSVLMGK